LKQKAAPEARDEAKDLEKPNVVSLDYTRPADEQIAVAVKAAILSMELPPGQLISEKEIGRRFGASRTPVRAAFAQLREEGLLTTWPSRGTFVTNLSLREIKAAQFLREAIETTVVQQLVEQGLTPLHASKLDKNLAEQQHAIDNRDDTYFRFLDDQFHTLLAEATGYERIAAALGREKSVLDRLRSMTLTDDGTMEGLRADHEAIVAAITARESLAAVDRLQTHLRSELETLSSLVEKNRGYFDIDESSGDT